MQYLSSTATSIAHSKSKEDFYKNKEQLVKNDQTLKLCQINFDIDYGCLEDDFLKQKMDKFNYNKMQSIYQYKIINKNKSLSNNKENSIAAIGSKKSFNEFTQFSNQEIQKALKPINNDKDYQEKNPFKIKLKKDYSITTSKVIILIFN